MADYSLFQAIIQSLALLLFEYMYCQYCLKSCMPILTKLTGICDLNTEFLSIAYAHIHGFITLDFALPACLWEIRELSCHASYLCSEVCALDFDVHEPSRQQWLLLQR